MPDQGLKESALLLVSGLDYSGTSLTAGILHHLGVDMGQWEAVPPPPEHPEQALAVAAGGHLRTWPTYEDTTVAQQCAQGVATWEPWDRYTVQAEVRFLLWQYARATVQPRGLKTNAACVLATVPSWVTCLIMTRRNEAERQERVRYYLGTLGQGMSRIRDIAAWCLEGYQRLLPQADVVVPFALVRQSPATVVDTVATALWPYKPSARQKQAAIDSIIIRQAKEVICHGQEQP